MIKMSETGWSNIGTGEAFVKNPALKCGEFGLFGFFLLLLWVSQQTCDVIEQRESKVCGKSKFTKFQSKPGALLMNSLPSTHSPLR